MAFETTIGKAVIFFKSLPEIPISKIKVHLDALPPLSPDEFQDIISDIEILLEEPIYVKEGFQQGDNFVLNEHWRDLRVIGLEENDFRYKISDFGRHYHYRESRICERVEIGSTDYTREELKRRRIH